MIPTMFAAALSALALAVPATGPKLPAPIDGVTHAKAAGVDVLVKRRAGVDVVAVQLYVQGGSRNWSAADAGVEALAFRVATSGGAGGLDKEAFGRELARMGSQIHASTTRDWSVLAAKGPTRHFDPLFRLLAACFTAPALPPAELKLQRERLVVELQQRQENPDGRLGELMTQALFAGHPYANPPEGTLESAPGLDLAAVTRHLGRLRERSRLLLVVVGDVEPQRVLDAVKVAFGALPEGRFKATPLPRPTFKSPRLVTEQRTIPTNYVQAMAPAPALGEPLYAAARIGAAVLRERLFVEIRTKRNLSYAPSAVYEGGGAGGWAGIYVTAVDPATTVPIMLGELARLASQPLSRAELDGTKALFRTRLLMGQETTDDEAAGLARGQLHLGDWRWTRRLLDEAARVDAAGVQAAARAAYRNLQFVLLGDPSKLDPKLLGVK